VEEFDEEATKNGWKKPQVIAHKLVLQRFNRYAKFQGWTTKINSRQFHGGDAENFDVPINFRQPDLVYDEKLVLDVGTERFEIFHGMGETDDASWVWIPRKRVVACGDFLIGSGPNAGNPQKVQRFPLEWAEGLEKMASLNPQYILPGHSIPIIGEERVQFLLQKTIAYLKQLVEDVVQLMNEGKRLNEIIHTVKPKQNIEEHFFLKASYDEPEFVIRNIWRLYGGW
jgi:glyoxylase-like metal-dependent hydrolase (beta-lactamase superfamily II)